MRTSRFSFGHAFLALTLAVALAPSVQAAPGQMSGTLGNLTGRGYTLVGQKKVSLANGMVLRVGSEIVLNTGKASLRLSDGTTIKLSAPTTFSIEGVDAAGRNGIRVDNGRAFVSTKQRSGREVRVNTPSATLAVRGSEAGVNVTAAGDADGEGTLCWCTEGVAYVGAPGQEGGVPLRAGYQVSVAPGQPPSLPVPMGEGTKEINEGLNLQASVSQTPQTTGGSSGSGGQGGGSLPLSDEQISAEHLAAAAQLLNGIFDAYEREDLNAVVNALSADFATTDDAGGTLRVDMLQEAFKQDFTNLDNISFTRLPGSGRFYKERDEVSLRQRWIISATLTQGARFQQAGETLFTVKADPDGGGLRITRWQGDRPFGRYHPSEEKMVVTSPTLITPPPADAPTVELSKGEVAPRGAEITGSDAHLVSGGTLIHTEQITFTPQGGIATGPATFELNGAMVTAQSMQIGSTQQFQANQVEFQSAGLRVEAQTLSVSGGTVGMTDASVTDSSGATVLLTQATLQAPSQTGGSVPVLSGTTASGQTVSTSGGQVVFDPAPGIPLRAGRNEKIKDAQGFQFSTEVITSAPSDLFLTGGRLLAMGVQDMGAMALDDLAAAPASGYEEQIAVSETLVGHVLAIKTESGRSAKLLVRSGTTAELLVFDWVYNPSATSVALRSRRYPTRAQVAFNAKVISRDASGQTFLHQGTESVAEVRIQSSRDFSNGASFEAYLAPRISTDRQVDNQSMVVDRFGLRYFQPNQMELSLGDLSGEFTPYTLNQNLLGLVGWRNFSIGPAGTAKLTAAVGPRWQPGSGFRFDGWVTGVRLATDELRDLGPLLEDMVVGVNVVNSHKGKDGQASYLSSSVVSFDATARLTNGLGLMGEWATSRSKGNLGQQMKGDALLLRGTYRLGPFRLILDRERVGGGFRTASGSAASDMERTNFWLRYRPSEWISANFNMLHTRDNLDGTLPYTTDMTVPRYGLSINPFYPLLRGGFLRNLTLDMLLSYNLRYSDDWARMVDKKYRSLSLSAIQRMGDFYLTLGQDEQRDMDFAFYGTSRRGRTNTLSLRWRPASGLFSLPISPIVGLTRGRDNYLGPQGIVASRVNGSRFGLEVGDPNSLAVELGYELTGNDRTDLGGYNRRVMNLDLTRALDRQGARTAGFSYRILRNKQENGARSTTEGQLTGSVSQQF